MSTNLSKCLCLKPRTDTWRRE